MCDSCDFRNFARNQDCKNCRAAKGYTESAMTMYGPSENGRSHDNDDNSNSNSNSNNISSIDQLQNRPGDWECGCCFEHNFADRIECYIKTCRSPREMGKPIVPDIGNKRARFEAFPTPAPELVNLKLQWTGRDGICRNARERKKMDVCQWWEGGKCKFGFNCRNRHEERPSGKSGVPLGLVTGRVDQQSDILINELNAVYHRNGILNEIQTERGDLERFGICAWRQKMVEIDSCFRGVEQSLGWAAEYICPFTNVIFVSEMIDGDSEHR